MPNFASGLRLQPASLKPKNFKNMKYETNFTEMAAIFAEIAKAETKIAEAKEAAAAYDAADAVYLSTGNPTEMLAAFERREKVEKALARCFKKIAAGLALDASNYEDKFILEDMDRLYNPLRFLCSAKRRAIALAQRIDIYA